MKIIHKSAGILLKERKLLVAKSFGKNIYISPGGKCELWESSEQTLVRELQEEFQIDVEEANLEYFNTYEAPAAGEEDTIVSMRVYFVHKWSGELNPNNEIEDMLWITSHIPQDIQVWSIFAHEILPKLHEMNVID